MILSFKQHITEDLDTETKLKKLGLKRGGMGFKIGKVIGGEVYVHKQYENQFPQDALNKAKSYLPKDYTYHVVKYNPKTGTFSFITSNDFDTNPEPSVNHVITVKSDGTVKQQKDSGWIYHHKWQWVADDYKGFDVEKEKQRSIKWSSLDGVDKSRIGQRKHWDDNVVPRLQESILQNKILNPSPNNIKKAKQFLLTKWKERAIERNSKEPTDLTNACKFVSIFAQKIFGGKIEGNYHHQYNILPNGEVLDLTDGAGNTSDKIYHDKKFFGNKEHKQSMESCENRVNQWVKEFYENF